MIYRFGAFSLDTAKAELSAGGEVRHIEPQVFALLALLVENRERLVSRDEIIEKVWGGRFISDAAVASRIKSARKALGDDGASQRFIKTLHGKGVRFLGDVRTERTGAELGRTPAPSSETGDTPPAADHSRPSIAVLPFRLIGDAGTYAPIADALPDELIAELSRMRWLFVIARASSFRLRAAGADMVEIGRALGVRYCLSGSVEIAGRDIVVTVELADTRGGSVIWADRFAAPVDEVHRVREDIRVRIVTALEIRIPLHEAALARLGVTENLDAWSSYHLGLQHMYRFNRKDNAAAAALFGQAVARDPTFARAHAGLSFVHFQTAFMRHSDDVAGEAALARRFAERGLELDPVDPFVNFTMGRSYWLEGDLAGSLGWLERATSLSPNYAHGIYARAWTESLAGRAAEGRRDADLAMSLSPLDPLYYAMLGTRALSHMAEGSDADAAAWGERAACSPGAHVLIAMIALAGHGIAGNDQKAAAWAANVRKRSSALTAADFFRSFPMQVDAARSRVADVFARYGF